MKIVVGTRDSRLAQKQASWIIDKLKKNYPYIHFEMKIVKTQEDLDQDAKFDQISDKGVFTSVLEQELLTDEIDIAVYPMKNMPSKLAEGLCLVAVPMREDAREALILKEDFRSLEDLPLGSKIGVENKGRAYQLLACRPDLQIIPICGDIDAKLRKFENEDLDGMVLSVAGLKRLGMEEKINYCFSFDQMLPVPCQGILAIEAKEENIILGQMLKTLDDPISKIAATAERAFMVEMNRECSIPVGAYSVVDGTHIKIIGLLGDERGDHLVIKEMCGPIGTEAQVGMELAKILRAQLAELSK